MGWSFIPRRSPRSSRSGFRSEGRGCPPQQSSQVDAVDTVFTASLSRLQHLADFASALVAAESIGQISDAWLDDGLKLARATAGSLLTMSGTEWEIVATAGVDDETIRRWTQFAVRPGAEPFSDALTTGQPQFFSHRESFVERYPHLAAEIEGGDHHGWAVLPLQSGRRTIGAVGIIYDEPNPFPDPLRLTLSTISSLLTQAVARAYLIDEQTATLRSVGPAVLEPRIDGDLGSVSVRGLYRPATTRTMAGGDWYDALRLDEKRTMFVIGDVANHGPVATGDMARVRTAIHTLALDQQPVDAIATKTAAMLNRLKSNLVTACIVIYDAETRTLTWTAAGHPYPLVRPAHGEPYYLKETHGPPLAAVHDHQYRCSQTVVRRGDTIILYTDGLIEQRGEHIDRGLERLQDMVSGDQGTGNLVDLIYDVLRPDRRHGDDVALLAATLQ